MKKTIGILGGMGPEATAYFFELIIKNTQAKKDQDHIPLIIYSNPRVPPRTDAILKRGPSPLSALLRGTKILRQAGADFIVMPCLTAHFYYPQIKAREKIPFLSLVEETLRYAQKKYPDLRKAGLIASTGTLESRLFHKTFAKKGIDIICPGRQEQKQVMEAIFGKEGIKAGQTSGHPKRLILEVAQKLVARGAQAIIAGCTEVPLVLKEEDLPVPFLEPMKITALACIRKAGYKVRKREKK